MYEACNIVLHKWTEALGTLGFSKNAQTTALQLWVMYLQRLGVAFIPKMTFFKNSEKSDIDKRRCQHCSP